ncbi:MAG: ROK family protein [Dehalococcoidales bacterium]|nr:ROK family protein [Dehalococcoidales bacterium]
MRSLYGGIEAGGTKFVCAVGTCPDDVSAEVRFATTTPSETIGRTIDFFRERPEPLTAIGIGSFGPLDLNPDSPTYGYITTTTKTGWTNTNFAGVLQEALNVPVLLDTDVNAAALGEHKWGVAQGLDTFIYLTVGTGIGGGGMVNGHLIHGLSHPEMGHVYIPHDPVRDPYPGCCLYHGDCLEGLACGPAIEERWGQPPETLPADHSAWRLEARYLALGLVNIIFALSPQRVIIGGGVLQQESLLPMVRKNVHELIHDFVPVPPLSNDTDSYIVLPALGQKAGVLGAIALAQQAISLP